MRLIPYTRKNELPARLWQDSSLFEDFFNNFPWSQTTRRREEAWLPAVDILEKDGNLIIRAELPGLDEKDIDLKLEGNILVLKGERKLDTEDSQNNYHRIESYRGTFSRSFTLPDTLDFAKTSADYKNGVLSVTIPQKPEIRPREIPVSSK